MTRWAFNAIALVSDCIRDLADRVHGWAIRKMTEANLRQLTLDYRQSKGWFK